MISQEIIPTRSALLELQAERTLVDEAYEFLDEKRMLLAAEILRQLGVYDELRRKLEIKTRQARSFLASATSIHGLQGISVYPVLKVDKSELTIRNRNYMGVTLATTELEYTVDGSSMLRTICNRTPEAQHCQQAFLELGKLSAVVAGVTGNLHRLLSEYRLTERRARALENVILPEIQETLDIVRIQLEEVELEEMVRTRL